MYVTSINFKVEWFFILKLIIYELYRKFRPCIAKPRTD